MTVPPVPFEGVEDIPGLKSVPDPAGEPAFLHLEGQDPVLIVACHSGVPGTTPSGAQVFGRRADPADASVSIPSSDINTLAISLAIVRALTSRGARPHALLSLVSRAFIEMNRSWEGQLGWNDGVRLRLPAEIDTPAGADLLAFKADYYDAFQGAVRRATTAIHPDGWLFDIHGQGNPGGVQLVVFTGYGHYARADISYGGSDNLHARLALQDYTLSPSAADPASEIRSNGRPIRNFMSGSAYGARVFDPTSDPVPFPGIVTPTEPHRVHGVQFEIDGALRRGRSPEALEETGLRIGTAIHDALLTRGVLPRRTPAQRGRAAREWYALSG